VNVSAPIRIFALVGALAALALGGWFFLLAPKPTAGAEPPKTVEQLRQARKAGAAAAPSKPKPAKAAAAPARAKAKPKPAAEVAARPAQKAKTRKVRNPEGLPLLVARALAASPVVVVSLYSPESKVDRISLAEARAGAQRAGAAFVALNVLSKPHSEPLTRKLGVLSAPAFLLYRGSGELVMRVDGFVDRDLVAQAALAAAPPGKPRPAR
jgi:hypothetical protein